MREVVSCLVLSLACLAAGCVPSLDGNAPREPSKEVPPQFTASALSSAAPPQSWREFFEAEQLRSLIEAALEKNQELNIQLQEIIIARNEVSVRQGEYLPRVSAGAGVGVEKTSRHTSQGVSDEAHGLGEHLGDFSFGLRSSWEIDVWGKLRNAAKAANLRYLASIESRNFMVTQIVAEIARNYVELLALDNQLELLANNIELMGKALELVKIEKQAARATELAVQRFEAELLKNKSRRFRLEQERTEAENRINFLVGRYPQKVIRDPRTLGNPLPRVASGLPADLLKNRPDIRHAELELEASELDVKSARAAFFPSLSIDADLGYRAFNPRHLLQTPDSLAYSLAGNLTAPLLNRKAIEAQYRSANARQIQAVFQYEKTVLQAFTEVVNHLARIENLEKEYDFLSRQVESLTHASEISEILFQSARAEYTEVLLTRRDLLDAEMERVETRKQQRLVLIDLYQALGGGWRSGS
jgi:NodT family efflux transporter outer membrane factor (OMF) lipoprotein